MRFSKALAAASAAAALWLLQPGLAAREQEPAALSEKRLLEARPAGGPIEVDGRLDEPAWSSATPGGDFTRRYPDPGPKAAFPTEVRVLYDAEALYVGVTCHDPEPDKIDRRMARRDRELPCDAVQFEIDTQNQGREAYYFRLSAAGTRIDAFVYNEFNLNYSWDAYWEAKAGSFPGGWCAEFRIPFRELRFSDGQEIRFGFQVQRDIGRLQEWDQWQYNPPNSNRRVSAFGTLVGLKDVAPGRPWDLVPYAAAKARTHTREPYLDRGFSADVGADFRFHLGTNFTLNGTVNPDFGQVEADRIVLNLSTYETFYPEKRPFFLEGFQIFSPPQVGSLIYLHTRRIGAPPPEPYAGAGEEVLSAPENTTILGAAKVTGTTDSGFTFGAFTALTQEEVAHVQAADGQVVDQQLLPQTLYSVVRFTQDLWTGSTVGLLVTDVERDSARDALVTALTWDLKFRDNRDQITGSVARSFVEDPGVRSWTGFGGEIELVHKPAPRWTLEAGLRAYDPDFRVNDLGYLRRNDFRQGVLSASYNHEAPGDHLLNWNANGALYTAENFDGVRLNRGGNFNAHATFLNYWSGFVGAELNGDAYDDRETRGGPLYWRPGRPYFWWGVESDSRKTVTAELWNDLWQTRNGWGWDAQLEFNFQPSDRVSFEPALFYNTYRGDFRWVDTLPGAGPGGSDQTVFADLALQEVGISGKASYLFTPDMTLDLYLQLFDATGHYAGFQEMLAPDAFQPAAYGGNPDFHDLGLAVNLVYRWEFKPGAELYAVYGRGQMGWVPFEPGEAGGSLSLHQDWSTLMNSPRDEVFLVKVRWRL